MKKFISFILLTIFSSVLIQDSTVYADKLCVKSKIRRKKVLLSKQLVSSGDCPKGTFELIDTSTLKGDSGTNGTNGTNGVNGADGSLRIYGDGSAGEFALTSGNQTLDQANLQFTNFSVAAGATLTVASGTIIRCTGTFTNDGNINVASNFGSGGSVGSLSANILRSLDRSPLPGPGGSTPYYGQYGTSAVSQSGGIASSTVLSSQGAKNLINPGRYGGGGGSGGSNTGGDGGGTLVVLAMGDLSNNGTISALGKSSGIAPGGGGGGGGIVTLASMTSTTNTGTVDASGGTGSGGTVTGAPSGGGGGGIVHFLAPIVNNTGTINISGGIAGTGPNVTSDPRAGGGAGGGSGGKGGNGATVATNNTVSGAQAGSTGYSFETEVDPTSLF